MGCLENTGIPSPVNDSNLENIFCRIVDKVGVSVIDTDIKNCDGVSNRGQTIVKFARGKVSKTLKSPSD